MERLESWRADKARPPEWEVEEEKRSRIEKIWDSSRRFKYLLARVSASSEVIPFCNKNVLVACILAIPE